MSSDDNLININCKNNSANKRMLHKYRIIKEASSQALSYNNAKFIQTILTEIASSHR